MGMHLLTQGGVNTGVGCPWEALQVYVRGLGDAWEPSRPSAEQVNKSKAANMKKKIYPQNRQNYNSRPSLRNEIVILLEIPAVWVSEGKEYAKHKKRGNYFISVGQGNS